MKIYTIFINFGLQSAGNWYILSLKVNRNGRFALFGYVNVYKEELKIKEFVRYRAYYCGLCKQLGHSYHQLARLGLSYDLAFLALLLDALSDGEPDLQPARCLKHLGAQRLVVRGNAAVRYCADMNVALTYEKLRDDWKDDRSVKALFAMVPYWFAIRRARQKYGEKMAFLRKKLSELSQKEAENCTSLDETADCFASLTAEIFAAEDSWAGNDNLVRLGYHIGRFIYILDAYDDMEEDKKRGRYNPVAAQYGGVPAEEIRQGVERSLTFTLAAAAEHYQALDVKRNREILDNIIYMGLRAKMDTILYQKG